MAVETVTTVTVNNNCQTYLPRNRFSRCSAFCFKQLFCVLYLSSADTPHAPPHPPTTPTRILSRYLQKVLEGTRVRGIGSGRAARRGKGKGGRERERGGRKRLSGSFIISTPSFSCSCPSWSPEGPGRRPCASQSCNLFITLIC